MVAEMYTFKFKKIISKTRASPGHTSGMKKKNSEKNERYVKNHKRRIESVEDMPYVLLAVLSYVF